MSEVLQETETKREIPFPKVTFEEFLQVGDEDTWAEWVNGEIIFMYSASSRHQEIAIFLGQVLGLYIRTNNLGKILMAPYPMRLEKINRGREPDLLFVANENLHLIKPTYLDGAADVVIEIVSPESVKRDREEKFSEYQAAGVKEYWLIDYENEIAEFYLLNKQGIYEIMSNDEIFYSQIVGDFFLRNEWLWLENLPTLEALRELKILS